MIKNDKQLEDVELRFSGWLDSFHKMQKSLDPESFRAYRLVHEPILLSLQKEINDYRALTLSKDETPYFTDPMEIGRWIVRHRIREDMTQGQLAEKLHLSQPQISREEDSEYRNSPLMRIYEIMTAFGYGFFEMAFFKNKDEMVTHNEHKVWNFKLGSQTTDTTVGKTSPIGSDAQFQYAEVP